MVLFLDFYALKAVLLALELLLKIGATIFQGRLILKELRYLILEIIFAIFFSSWNKNNEATVPENECEAFAVL